MEKFSFIYTNLLKCESTVNTKSKNSKLFIIENFELYNKANKSVNGINIICNKENYNILINNINDIIFRNCNKMQQNYSRYKANI